MNKSNINNAGGPALVSIVVPVYNEVASVAETLRTIHKVMKETACAYEIIAVDDGSADGTAEAIRIEGVRVYSHSRNKGYGAAIKTGIRHSRGEVVVIIDADGTYPPEEIPRLLRLYIEKECDMVVGARIGSQAKIPLLRRPPKWVISRLANFLVGEKIPDLNSGLRVMKKAPVLEYFRMLPDGFSLTTTVTLALISGGYKVEFSPIPYLKRAGKSKFHPIGDTLNFIQMILRSIMFFNPMKLFLPLSLLFFASGFAFLVRDLIRLNLAETSMFLLMAGGIVLSIGLLADLIIKKL